MAASTFMKRLVFFLACFLALAVTSARVRVGVGDNFDISIGSHRQGSDFDLSIGHNSPKNDQDHCHRGGGDGLDLCVHVPDKDDPGHNGPEHPHHHHRHHQPPGSRKQKQAHQPHRRGRPFIQPPPERNKDGDGVDISVHIHGRPKATPAPPVEVAHPKPNPQIELDPTRFSLPSPTPVKSDAPFLVPLSVMAGATAMTCFVFLF